MLMADTMAIFFVILGLLLAFPGLWVLCRGLWPRAVAKAAAVCGKGLIKPFFAGLPLTAGIIFAAAVLGNLGPAGKIAAVATVCLYLMFANCGRGERRCVEALLSDWLLYCRFSDGS